MNNQHNWSSPRSEVRSESESFGLVTEHHRDIGVLCAVTHLFAYWMSAVSVMHVIFFIAQCGITCFLCAMRMLCVYSWIPQATLVPNFFFHGLHCWAAEKSRTQSLSHLFSLFDVPGTEAFALEKKNKHLLKCQSKMTNTLFVNIKTKL